MSALDLLRLRLRQLADSACAERRELEKMVMPNLAEQTAAIGKLRQAELDLHFAAWVLR